VVAIAVVVLSLQFFATYERIRNTFRWLAFALLAYVAAAFFSKPDLAEVLKGTLVPRIRFNQEFLSMVVAVIGTTLSAYLYTWQSNQEVEEKIEKGRVELSQRVGTSERALQRTRREIFIGMTFSNVIMYFIILATGATLHQAGKTDIESAAQAAEALRPLAGNAAGILFALGIIGVGLLAVPVMTTGAAYDLTQALGWKHSLHARPSQAKKFYGAIAAFTAVAVALNFMGFNPMRALVFSGIVQGF
ncbi:MAG: divalent metal cation transporter, partial [Rhizobacter sp.]|nr:divalent metal cation transporter [Rhizobacter sp.]